MIAPFSVLLNPIALKLKGNDPQLVPSAVSDVEQPAEYCRIIAEYYRVLPSIAEYFTAAQRQEHVCWSMNGSATERACVVPCHWALHWQPWLWPRRCQPCTRQTPACICQFSRCHPVGQFPGQGTLAQDISCCICPVELIGSYPSISGASSSTSQYDCCLSHFD